MLPGTHGARRRSDGSLARSDTLATPVTFLLKTPAASPFSWHMVHEMLSGLFLSLGSSVALAVVAKVVISKVFS